MQAPDRLSSLADLVSRFQQVQRGDGSIAAPNTALAQDLLKRIQVQAHPHFIATQGRDLSEAFHSDVSRWLGRGLNTSPLFDQVRATLRAPAPGERVFVVAPVVTANGPAPRGAFLEFFMAQRSEPSTCIELAKRLPHPKNRCQSLQLAAASRGFARGNCIVFFPENTPASQALAAQPYAMFFFSKFRSIYHHQTLNLARQCFGAGDAFFGAPEWLSARLDESDCYSARCIWGYLHDYFHHQGPKPFDAHIALKCNWFAGLLEELKVDCQSALACLDTDVSFGREIFEFILLERLLRYPCQPDATSNFDAGSGVLLRSWLLRDGALVHDADRLRVDLPRLRGSLRSLVQHILDIDGTADDLTHKQRSQAFVREFLPEGVGVERFAMPTNWRSTPLEETP